MEDNKNEVSLGTLYDFNKSILLKQKELTKKELEGKRDIVNEYLHDITKGKYYMLLCREQNDYTLFNIFDDNYMLLFQELKECLLNRGKVKAIDFTQNKDAIEIWLEMDKEMFCYYFFLYDNGVVEVKS